MNEKIINEEETLLDMIAWIDKRIAELPKGTSIYYQNMKESLEWELKTVRGEH